MFTTGYIQDGFKVQLTAESVDKIIALVTPVFCSYIYDLLKVREIESKSYTIFTVCMM